MKINKSTSIIGWLGLLAASTWLNWPNWQASIWLLIGFFGGWIFLWLDEFWLARFYREGNETLVTRSPLFMVLLAPLALFIVTSTDVFLGRGLILGIVLGLVSEFWHFRSSPEAWSSRYLVGSRINWDEADIYRFTWVATGFAIVLTGLVVFIR